jgi:hypothetical protein
MTMLQLGVGETPEGQEDHQEFTQLECPEQGTIEEVSANNVRDRDKRQDDETQQTNPVQHTDTALEESVERHHDPYLQKMG